MVYRTNSRRYSSGYTSKWMLSAYRWIGCWWRSKSWPIWSYWIPVCWCALHHNWRWCFRSKSVPYGFGWRSRHFRSSWFGQNHNCPCWSMRSWWSYRIPMNPSCRGPCRSCRRYCRWWTAWSQCRTNRNCRLSSWKRWCSCFGWSGCTTRCCRHSSCFWWNCMNGRQRTRSFPGRRRWPSCWFWVHRGSWPRTWNPNGYRLRLYGCWSDGRFRRWR